MATIRKRGEYQWEAQVRKKGYPSQTKTFKNKADAERWARQVETEMDRGVFVSRFEAERMTLDDLIDRYTKEILPSKKGARQDKSRMCRLSEEFGKYSLMAIMPSAVAAYRDKRLKQVSGQTVIHELTMLTRLYTAAIKDFGIAVPSGIPTDSINFPPTPKGRDRRLLPGEEKRIFDHLGTIRNRYVKPVAQLALETAMRRGELLALRWQHVDLTRRVVHLPSTKNGESRNVPLSTTAVAVLKGFSRAITGPVFPLSETALVTAWERAIEKCRAAYVEEQLAAGKPEEIVAADPMLVDLRFHDLRHEATSRLAEKLPNLIELASVTGHKDLRMLKRYYHPRAEDLALKLG